MDFLLDYGLFLAKIATVVIAIAAILIIVKGLKDHHGSSKGELEVTDLTEQYKHTVSQLESHLFDKPLLKARDKAEKKAEKEKNKARQTEVKKRLKKGICPILASHVCLSWTSTAALTHVK
ncbi:possible protease sohB [Photobacterium aphoticum]|uniref:Possible protease sohB n=1 Tax=Photobacterium aphoticum TaxID=754436 RepID=A0A090RB19_9GAMM|nr:possible protease sohB [Photobacterium aphoticum]